VAAQPLSYTFTAADAGGHVFSITFASTGTQTVGTAILLFCIFLVRFGL
jgi:hypothetical protein